MRNLRLTRAPQVRCRLTADQWQLFTASRDCSRVAALLNIAFEDAVNGGGSLEQVRAAVEAVMREYRDYGATDSEPRHTLDVLIEQVFGRY